MDATLPYLDHITLRVWKWMYICCFYHKPETYHPLSFSLGFDATDQRWVGAWWLGFIFTSIAFVVVALPLFGYPKYMSCKLCKNSNKTTKRNQNRLLCPNDLLYHKRSCLCSCLGCLFEFTYQFVHMNCSLISFISQLSRFFSLLSRFFSIFQANTKAVEIEQNLLSQPKGETCGHMLLHVLKDFLGACLRLVSLFDCWLVLISRSLVSCLVNRVFNLLSIKKEQRALWKNNVVLLKRCVYVPF